MSDESTTITPPTGAATGSPEDKIEIEVDELTRDRVRGNDGKFLSRAAGKAAQARGMVQPKPEDKPNPEPKHEHEVEPGQEKPTQTEQQQEENKGKPYDKGKGDEALKSDKLRRILELEAKTRDTAQRVEQREKEVVQFYDVAKQYEQKLVDREKALAERERTWTGEAINADPIGWLIDHKVDPDRLLQALADSDGRRKAVEARRSDPRDQAIEELRSELKRLREEGPEWLRKEREQQQAQAHQASVAEAEKWFSDQATDAKKYPSILRVLDPDEVVPKVRAILQEAKAKKESLDDDAIMGRLESTCRSKLDRITSTMGAQGAKQQGQAAGVQGTSSREPEPSLSSALSGQRAALPERRSRAERLKDFDLGKYDLKD